VRSVAIEGWGLCAIDVLQAIQGLTRATFYKSMTTHADHRVWQDVYHANTRRGQAYVKFTLRENGAVVISFKELDNQ